IPLLHADLTTARMTALRPGASPPPVSTPIRLMDDTHPTIANGFRATLPQRKTACYTRSSRVGSGSPQSGRLAQLGERRVRNAEVGSSSLLPSTKFFTNIAISDAAS